MSDDLGDVTDDDLRELFGTDRELAEEFLRQLNEMDPELTYEAVSAMTDDMHERHELMSRAHGS